MTINKVDELAKIIETGLAEGGALYDIDFVALNNARTALAELVSLAHTEERRRLHTSDCAICGGIRLDRVEIEFPEPHTPQRNEG